MRTLRDAVFGEAMIFAPADVVLTGQEVADYWLHIHRNTLRKIPPEELPYFRIGSRGDRRYRVADVRAYIERREAR